MDIEPRKYLANQLKPHPVLLKEILPQKKKDVQALGGLMNTLIIDYGSQNTKAGYDWSADGPDIVFRPQISKNRDPNKTDLPIKTYINTSYDQLDITKVNYKSPYERNLILHFSLFEQCNDYIFSELQKPNKKIRCPLMISQPFGNPIHCRNSILEQFFECYEIDSVMIGVDALFAYYYQVNCNMDRYEKETALVVSMGANCIHVFSVVEGKVSFESVRRLNFGGNIAFELFAKSLILKNPQLRNKLTYSFLRDIYEKFTSVAIDYREQLRYFQSKFKEPKKKSIYRNKIQEDNLDIEENLSFIQGIEIDFDTIIEIPEEEIKRKQEVKKRMAEKLKQTLNRRKQMKNKIHEMQLKNLIDLRQKYEAHDKFAHEEVVQIFGEHKALDKLEKKIKSLEIKLGKIEDKPDENKFALINIPDHQLPPEKLKYKKLQIYQKQAVQIRRQKQKEREEEEAKMKELRENNPQVYLHQLKEKYKAKYAKFKENERIKNQLNNRKSKLKQRKMQAMARLVEDELDENFGQNEDDWLAYKDPEESDHYSQLDAMQAELRQIDPDWTQSKDHHHLKQTNQLFLLVDLIKCHEAYFQPSILGINQMGLIQTIVSSLAYFKPNIIQQLLGNVILVGGGSVILGLKERIERDLKRECPTGSVINVKIGRGGAKGAFLGMQNIGKNQREFLDGMSYKRQEYLSKNGNIFVSNPWSNPAPFK